jgi:general secretion pathway protein D
MSVFNRLLAIALAAFLALPPAPLLAKTRKGDKLRNEARAAEIKGDYDQALKLADQAVQEDPSDPSYVLEARRVRFEDGVMHVSRGDHLRDAGRLDEALAEFQRALEVDPASDLAAQEVKRTKQMIERNKNGGQDPTVTVTPEDLKTLTPAALARKRVQERSDALLPVPELRPLNTDLIDLKMTNQRPRILFETVGKIAGINVVFDPEYDTQQTIRSAEIDLTRTTLDQALDELSVITRSFWKPLSPNTIFVTIDNPAKRREYSEQVVKVYYLSNTTTPQEVQELLTVLRTVTDVQKVFNYTAQNALIVRAEADTMALVDKLISDLDKPRSEVIVDVMVMEVSSSYIRTLTGLFSNGINTSAVFAPRPGITTPGLQSVSSTATTTTGTTTSGTTTTTPTTTTTTPTTTTGSTSVTEVPLNALGHISSADYSLTTLPGATFEALLTDSSTRILQAPQIRAVDNAKASLKIGDKVPTASGSFQSGVAGVGVSPLVNTQFTYLDVGVNVEITPKVHENNEVSMHLDLDVSQVAQYVNLGGINEPEISQNKLTTDIRLRQGEVNLIGGIIQQTDSKSTSGIPGLGSIPFLGKLFNGDNIDKERTELVIALIPHVVRGQDIDATNLKGVAAGNATQIKVNYGPRPATPTEQPQGVVTTPSSTISAPAAPPATAPPQVLAPPPPPAQGPAQAQGPVRVTFAPPNVDTQLNATVTVSLTADNVTDMISAGAQLRYDSNILRVTSITTGDLPQRNVAPLQPTQNILNDVGLSDMSVSRGPQDGGVSGGGVLFTVVFQTIGRGLTNVTVAGVSLTSSTGQPINATGPPPLVVNVR